MVRIARKRISYANGISDSFKAELEKGRAGKYEGGGRTKDRAES